MPKSRLEPVKAEIVERRIAGETMQAIGDRFGCSREMIRLICVERGVKNTCPSRAQVRRLFYAVAVAARIIEREARPYPHGTRTGYDYGCSCADCRRAQNDYMKRLRERGMAPNHGTVSGYKNYRCHCRKCMRAYQNWCYVNKEIKAQYQARYYAKQRKSFA